MYNIIMKSIDSIVALAKRRGFVFPSSEIYGGFTGVYDYGPLGVELSKNIKDYWWNNIVRAHSEIVGLDSGIIMNPEVWRASGHTEGFSDPMTVCSKTGKSFRADHLLEEIGIDADENMDIEDFIKVFEKNRDKLKPEGCNPKDLSTPSSQSLLVDTNMGTTDEQGRPYLRGETCQGIYVNFKQVVDSTHMKLPFGIAQIGKAFRNEISPRQFLFRTREFEQMEMQYFIYPKDAKKFFDEWKDLRLKFLIDIGISKENLRVTPHDRLVFYAKEASDIEYNYSFGWKELEGIHNRGDYDLTQHTKCSGEKLTYFDQETETHITPHIIETSIGVGRLFLALLQEAYTEETLPDGTERTVLKFNFKVAPMKFAVLPLMRKGELPDIAKKLYNDLSKKITGYYDETGSIGKRYRRADEIGTPFAITIDFETEKDASVTIRNRDTMEQSRVVIEDVLPYIEKHL